MTTNNFPAWKAILLSGFTAGTLDIAAAIINRSIETGKNSTIPVLKYVASGVFGKSAFKAGDEMAIAGLVFHFMIAFGFAIAYFFAYPHIAILRKNKIISGLVYGILVWLIMNRIIVPLSLTPPTVFKWSFSMLKHIGILMVFIGLPVALITDWYYRKFRKNLI